MTGWTDHHVHQWGPVVRMTRVRRLKSTRVRWVAMRLCTNGWCPFGKYRNGKLCYDARPERKP